MKQIKFKKVPQCLKNLIILCSDEHRADFMGAAGCDFVHTPHLDALAARGVRFTNAYTPSPICVPARASLATGRYAHETGYWDNALAYEGRVPAFGHALEKIGVPATSIGKLHYQSADDDTGFARQIIPMHIKDGVGMVWASMRNPLPETRRMDEMLAPIGPGESDHNRYDMAVAAEDEAWLSEAPSEPWWLFVSMVAPHFPLTAPQAYWDTYPDPPWPNLRSEAGYERHPWLRRMQAFAPHDDILGDDLSRRDAIRGYLALTTFMDAQMGRVLAALDASGQAEDTLVIYLSDHGEILGARNNWGKSVLYGEASRVPLVMAGPGIAPGVCDTPVSLVDIAPTACAYFGAHFESHGADLRAIAKTGPGRERIVFSEYHAAMAPTGGFMVANADWAYRHYIGYAPELFDLSEDPEQAQNQAGAPAHAAIEARMHAALLEICDPEAVDARAKADQDALVARHGGPDRALNIGPRGATPIPG